MIFVENLLFFFYFSLVEKVARNIKYIEKVVLTVKTCKIKLSERQIMSRKSICKVSLVWIRSKNGYWRRILKRLTKLRLLAITVTFGISAVSEPIYACCLLISQLLKTILSFSPSSSRQRKWPDFYPHITVYLIKFSRSVFIFNES